MCAPTCNTPSSGGGAKWTPNSHSNQFSAEVSSDRINLSPFTKDYRGLALQCDLHVFVARTRAHHQNRNQQPKRNPCRAFLFFSRNRNFYFFIDRSHFGFVCFSFAETPWTCLQTSSGRNYLSRRGTVENHTFSAFWLRSSVVSVLISLISGTWRMASHEFK